MNVKQIVVKPNIEFIYEVSDDFDIHNNVACTALLSNGTPVAESNDQSDVSLTDTGTGEVRNFYYEG